jgi:hypothetical protein
LHDIEGEEDMEALIARGAGDVEEPDREHRRASRADLFAQFDVRDRLHCLARMIARAARRDFQAPAVEWVTVLADEQHRAVARHRHDADRVRPLLVGVGRLALARDGDAILPEPHPRRGERVCGCDDPPAEFRALRFVVHLVAPFHTPECSMEGDTDLPEERLYGWGCGEYSIAQTTANAARRA